MSTIIIIYITNDFNNLKNTITTIVSSIVV